MIYCFQYLGVGVDQSTKYWNVRATTRTQSNTCMSMTSLADDFSRDPDITSRRLKEQMSTSPIYIDNKI